MRRVPETEKTSSVEDQTKQGMVYALRLLTISMRSERDLRFRLQTHGYVTDAIDRVIAQLKQTHTLDEERTAKSFVDASAYGAVKGKKRLQMELRKKGFSEPAITKAVNAIDPAVELERALEFGRNRFEKMQDLPALKRKQKLFAFLVRRGFDYEICREVVELLSSKQK